MNYIPSGNNINQGFYTYVTDSLIYTRPIQYSLDMLRAGASYKGYGLNYNENIYVFDWNGKLIKKYELDTPIYSFVVDEKNKTIYAETDDLDTGDSIIRKYEFL